MRGIYNLKLRGYDKATLSNRLDKNSSDQYDVTVKQLGVIFYLSFLTLSLLQRIKNNKSNMALETLNDYIFNLSVFIIIFIDGVTSMFNRFNQCRKAGPRNAV